MNIFPLLFTYSFFEFDLFFSNILQFCRWSDNKIKVEHFSQYETENRNFFFDFFVCEYFYRFNDIQLNKIFSNDI